ncbi:tRNA (adenosine(37)-N6)-threonylcarbamoyltransferase complex ATPase subunit type 1 TsaE [Patescibacteria group bacterium]|nr:tRNA (adenosine(37)-N6)-threonylcarbamoyltransferase complex ATPase subunit type 1 TsaE [Patescibacteria group bacterium]
MKKTSFKNYSNSVGQTRKMGKIFAEKIIKKPLFEKAVIIGLVGDLGSGKTAFLQGFAKGLGIKEKVLSPTFLIIKRFPLNNKKIKKWDNFYHIDCYRIEDLEELLQLNFEKIIQNPKNIIAVEWADKIRKKIPLGSVFINFTFIDKNKRKISVCQNRKK